MREKGVRWSSQRVRRICCDMLRAVGPGSRGGAGAHSPRPLHVRVAGSPKGRAASMPDSPMAALDRYKHESGSAAGSPTWHRVGMCGTGGGVGGVGGVGGGVAAGHGSGASSGVGGAGSSVVGSSVRAGSSTAGTGSSVVGSGAGSRARSPVSPRGSLLRPLNLRPSTEKS